MEGISRNLFLYLLFSIITFLFFLFPVSHGLILSCCAFTSALLRFVLSPLRCWHVLFLCCLLRHRARRKKRRLLLLGTSRTATHLCSTMDIFPLPLSLNLSFSSGFFSHFPTLVSWFPSLACSKFFQSFTSNTISVFTSHPLPATYGLLHYLHGSFFSLHTCF